jgi:hypothetical protein
LEEGSSKKQADEEMKSPDSDYEQDQEQQENPYEVS